MKKVDISIKNLSKVEGHAGMDVKVRNGEVQEVHIKFTDAKRFFTQAIRNREIDTLPQSVARICGTCSIAHTMGCIEAIEKALNIKPSQQTQLLKKLTMNGLMIRDHALHLYLFALPDVFNKDSVLDFNEEEMQFVKDCFDIKKIGNKLDTLVAGRAVHAPFPMVGGFAEIPDNKTLKALIPELKLARKKLLPVLDAYYNSKTDYTRPTNFVALVGKDFDFLSDHIETSGSPLSSKRTKARRGLQDVQDSRILASTKEKIPEEKYLDHLDKVVLPYSEATGYEFEDDTYLVGALARINLNKKALHPNTKKDAAKYLEVFPSNNIFHNNLAQAIEIMHAIDSSIDIIKNTKFIPEEPIKPVYKDSVGVGVIEAPRGILYYRLFLKKNGMVKQGNIITPTQQNQINIELDVKKLVQDNLDKLSKEEIKLEIEKLIRAYDPCISCATHFLKLNWI